MAENRTTTVLLKDWNDVGLEGDRCRPKRIGVEGCIAGSSCLLWFRRGVVSAGEHTRYNKCQDENELGMLHVNNCNDS